MVEDFIMDPVLGVRVIMNLKLDAFQRVRLKICHWVPRVMDSSGFSSAKSIGAWAITNLRPILFPGRCCGVYYPTFDAAKRIYIPNYTKVARNAPLFRAQLGRPKVIGLDGSSATEAKALMKGPSCWSVTYKNGSEVLVPAPGFLQDAKTQAGQRFSDLYIDEWTKVEATGTEGIDEQLIGRVTLESWNKNHPIYRNHILFSATAEDTMHKGYTRYAAYKAKVAAGDPDYAMLAFNYKDYSDLPAS